MQLALIPIDRHFPDKERLFAINNEAFPDDERIDNAVFFDVLGKYGCRPYAFYDKETVQPKMVGFATVMYCEPLHMGYIWYFAIADDCRGKGFGSACMQLLQKHFPEGTQLVLDMEQVMESASNYTQRLRRLSFYERNGYLRTQVGITYFGMQLELMCWPAPFRGDDFEKLLDTMRDGRFEPRLYPVP